jgi:hypothetical protein
MAHFAHARVTDPIDEHLHPDYLVAFHERERTGRTSGPWQVAFILEWAHGGFSVELPD